MRKTSDIIKTVDTILVEANGIEFEVDTQGEGERLVLCLHGWPEHSITWRFQMPYLASLGYRVWAPNLRGYGNTNAPKGMKHYQLEILMEDVAALIKASNAKEVIVLAHDWGALIAWHFAMRYPDAINRLVICNVPHPAPFLKAMTKGFEQLFRSWYVLFFQLPWLPEMISRNISAGRLIRGGAATRRNYPDEVVALFDENASRPQNRTAMINYYRALLRGGGLYRQWKLGFPKIEVPTLMLWGEKDIALSMTSTLGTEEHVEDFNIRYFRGISHHVQQDAPEEVNAMLNAFLANETVPEYLDIKI
tara:strand:- start:96 stop:1013 length:918 start_codon:yes stop_codon:yes gene_type:complete